MKCLLLALLSFSVNAEWFLLESTIDRPVLLCKTLGALSSWEIEKTGEPISAIEKMKIENDCTISRSKTRVNPQFFKLYIQIQATNYENERKVYFVNTRDVVKE